MRKLVYDKEKFDILKESVENESEIIHQFMRDILKDYTTELDELVEDMDTILKAINEGLLSSYTEEQLEYYSLKLPVLMYKASSRLEELGSNSDIAKANRKKMFNNLTIRLRKDAGTVAEKKATAEMMVENEQLVEDLYYRVYNQLKIKLEYADGVFTSIKKVISKRMLDLEVFRKDLGTDEDYNSVNDNSLSESTEWKEYKKR